MGHLPKLYTSGNTERSRTDAELSQLAVLQLNNLSLTWYVCAQTKPIEHEINLFESKNPNLFTSIQIK